MRIAAEAFKDQCPSLVYMLLRYTNVVTDTL